jgi:hypothetical protein
MSDILLGKELDERKTAITDTVGEITIDTCIGFDTSKWETGIDKGAGFDIVEQYEDEESAKLGHAKWVNAIKSNPNVDLPNLTLWE